MLLRYRSRGVTTKPTLMADHNSNNQNSTTSQSRRTRTTIPSLFLASSKLIRDFTNTFITPTSEVLKSPTSTLDTTRLLLSPNHHHRGFGGNPFSYYDNNNNTKTVPIKTSFSETKRSWEKSVSRGIGLALVKDGDDEDNKKIDEIHCGELPNKGNVLFGTQLRVKTVSAETNCYEGKESKDHCSSSPTGLLSLSEMDQLSEEYTCVTPHGPNPKTTHIFNNCIVESYYCSSYSFPQNSASRNLLGVCYTCKKHLDHTKDIFIYRGEKAFCSRECRQREMMLDGLEESLEFENSSSNGYYS